MSKRFVNPALFGPLCFVLLTWQLSVLAPCQSQVRPDMTSNVSRAQEASAAGVAFDLSRKKVLILHTFTYDTSAYLVMDPIFLKGFADAGLDASNLYFEFLDLLRHGDQAHRRETTEHLRRKFTDQPIDLIIAVHRTALSYLLEDGKGLFPGVPVVNVIADPDWLREDFRTANEHRLQELKRPSVIMPLAIGTEPTIKNILTLLPETRTLVVISGSDRLDRLTEQSVRRTLEAWHGRLQVEYLSGLPLEEVLERVSALSPKTAILYTVFGADTKGRTYRNYDVLRRISRGANAPIFGLYDTLLGNGGIVGGTMPTYSVEAARTVRLALEILRGRLPAEPVTILPAPTHPVFDWPELKRWGLNESALPADAIILNKPVSAWEMYKLYIIGAVAFCVLETVLIIFLIVQKRRKKVAEESLSQRTEELDQFFNVSLDLLAIANMEGYFLRLNPAAERILGYTREELMTKQFLDFVHPEDLDRTREAISTLASQQKVFSFENRYRCKDGTYRWLQWSSVPAGNLIYAAARDVTDRKEAQQALVERLRFERLVSGISAKFVNIPPDRVDSEIEGGLRQILQFFQVDRCGLVRTLPGKTAWQITHLATAEDVPMIPQRIGLPVSIRPWAFEKLIRRHEIVSFSKIDDLPTEANVDRQGYIEWGVKSTLNIPIITGEPADHILAINSVKSERVWPEELIPRLRLLGEILVNALERKQIRLQIEERLRFEGLLAHLSAGFVNLPSNEVESQINRELRSIAEFFDVDRCSVGLFSEDGTRIACAFEYHLAEVGPTPESASKEEMPWCLERLIGGNSVVINRVEDLPPEAEKDRQICAARGLKSVLSIPMLSESKTLGSCALVSTRAERVWSGELVQRLQLICEVFANALQRKQTEEALRESEDRFRQVAESVGDFIWEIDANGLYRYTSPSVERILGYRPDELIGKKHFYDLFAPEVREELKSAALTAFARKQPFRAFPNPNVSKEGRVVEMETSGLPILDDGGNLVGFRGADTDVTERRKFEKALAESQAQIAAVMNSTKDFIWSVDPERFGVLTWNRAFGDYFLERRGIELKAGMTPAELVPPDYVPFWHDVFSRALREEFVVAEYVVVAQSMTLLLSLHAMRRNGKTFGISVFGRDITERKRAEAEVNRARTQLLHVERSARMGELTASLAHELNQPLAAILSNAQAALRFLQSDKVDFDEFREILHDIVQDDQRAGNVIRSLRSMMKREERERNPIILNNVVNEVIQIFHTESIFRNVHIDTEFDELLPPVLGDKVQLQQVALNLIVNAADAMSQNPPEHRKIILRTQVKDNRIRVTIRDFGPGIDQGDLDRIFQPFFTTKGTGLGMGLAVSQTIVEAHGGHIWAENNPDGGATFFIELPVISDR